MSEDAASDARAEIVPDFPLGRLQDARDALGAAHRRLVRSAARSGQEAPPAPAVRVIREYWISRCARCHRRAEGVADACSTCGHDVVACRPFVDLEISWSGTRLAGWEFLAAVESLVGGNLIRMVPGAAIRDGELAAWRESYPRCDHCHADRHRSETFVVRADGSDAAVAAGTLREVGRDCLRPFLGGRSPDAIVSSIGWRDLIAGIAGEDGGTSEESWSRGDVFLPSLEFLTWAQASARVDGWVSRSAAQAHDARSTASRALYLMRPPWDGRALRDWEAAREACRPSEADRARAAAALAWARALAGASDYEHNLKIVAAQPALNPQKHAGILASTLAAYARHLSEEIRRSSRVTAADRYLGEVGERRAFEGLTCERVASYDGTFGPVFVHAFRDRDGCSLVWRTGSGRRTNEGDVVDLVGTIKAHDKFRGEARTELARCALLEAGELARRAAASTTRGRRSKARRSDA